MNPSTGLVVFYNVENLFETKSGSDSEFLAPFKKAS